MDTRYQNKEKDYRMDRGYEEQLIAARINRENNEEAGYPDDVKLMVSSMVLIGEDPTIIASILEIDVAVIMAWNHQFNQTIEFALRQDEFTFIRDKNKLRPDARTKACVVKACIEEGLTNEEAALILDMQASTVKTWNLKYRRYYQSMIHMPAGSDIKIKPTYVMGLDHREELQELIYSHDRQENTLAGTRRIEYLQQRNIT